MALAVFCEACLPNASPGDRRSAFFNAAALARLEDLVGACGAVRGGFGERAVNECAKEIYVVLDGAIVQRSVSTRALGLLCW